MKRYIKSNDSSVETVNIIVEVGWSDDDSNSTFRVAAATFDSKVLPKGPLLPTDKDAIITSQMLEDYHAFIESVEDLITEFYGLTVYYKNDSLDNSFYFGMIAKDNNGVPVLEFNFTLRISNHPAHRSEASMNNKKLQKEALQKETNGAKLKPITKSILVNDETFNNYEEAYKAVDLIIERVVKIMIRKKN